MLYKKLPKEIINKILDIEGSIKYRNGKYINQIKITNKKYECINFLLSHKIYLIKNFPLIFKNISKIQIYEYYYKYINYIIIEITFVFVGLYSSPIKKLIIQYNDNNPRFFN